MIKNATPQRKRERKNRKVASRNQKLQSRDSGYFKKKNRDKARIERTKQ